MPLSAALARIAQDPQVDLDDRRAAIRLLALLPARQRGEGVAVIGRLGQDSTLPEPLLAEAGRARARLDLLVGRDLARDDVDIANLSPAAYLAYDETIAGSRQ